VVSYTILKQEKRLMYHFNTKNMKRYKVVLLLFLFYSCSNSLRINENDYVMNISNQKYYDLGNEYLIIHVANHYISECEESDKCFSLYIAYSPILLDTFLLYDSSLINYEINDTIRFHSNKKMHKDYPNKFLPGLTEESNGYNKKISRVYNNNLKYCIGFGVDTIR